MRPVGAHGGGSVSVAWPCWALSLRMIAHCDKTNREEHAALMRAIAALGERVTPVEVRLGERMAAVAGKLDLLIAQQQKP